MFQDIEKGLVPFIGVTKIEPLQSPLQIGLLMLTIGWFKLGGPGWTKIVSGPKPTCWLQVDQPALQEGYSKWQV